MKNKNLSRTVKLTLAFIATAASWHLKPEELARRVCDDFGRRFPPGSTVTFIAYASDVAVSRPKSARLRIPARKKQA